MSENGTRPTQSSFIALYSDYVTLRAMAARGKATRAELVALAARLADAVTADATALQLAEAPQPPPHAQAWAGRYHPLERVPRAPCRGHEEGRMMERVNGKWTPHGDGKRVGG